MTNNLYNFSAKKMHIFIKLRNVSFKEIISAIEEGYLIDVCEHPNIHRYAQQKIYIVEIDNYIYLVFFVIEKDGTNFLKTIIPCRRATKKYLKKENEYEK